MSELTGDALTFRAPEFRFGDGVASELPEALERLGVEDPLVVTDPGVRDAGIAERVTDGLDDYREVDAATEPSVDDFRDLPGDAVDGVVAIGGGSCLDAAKVAALLLEHGGDPADYIGTGNVPGPVAPFVAVPTTSGTGSQSTQTAVLTYEGVKRGISDEHLRASLALVDPTLTFDLPARITARSGFDAFVHALESLTARDYRWVPERDITYQGVNPVTEPLSRRALDLVHGTLERAVYDGDDRSARRAMSLGSHLAGLAFSNCGLGGVHALASAVGGMTGRPHGECLAASLEPGLRYNYPVRRDAYADVARHLGVGETADDLLAEATRLRDAIDLPAAFADIGLDASDVDDIVEATLVQERRLVTNPRDVRADLRDAVAAAFDGDR